MLNKYVEELLDSNLITEINIDTVDIPSDEDLEFLSEEYLERFKGKPVGVSLREQMAANKKLPVRSALYDVYLEEKDVIKNPLDYCGTKPDIEIRYTL